MKRRHGLDSRRGGEVSSEQKSGSYVAGGHVFDSIGVRAEGEYVPRMDWRLCSWCEKAGVDNARGALADERRSAHRLAGGFPMAISILVAEGHFGEASLGRPALVWLACMLVVSVGGCTGGWVTAPQQGFERTALEEPSHEAETESVLRSDALRVPEGACLGESESNLEGVRLTAWAPACQLSRDTLAAGTAFGWFIEVDDALHGVEVVARPLDGGGCSRPDASGFAGFPSFHQEDVQWCRCDVGLCVPTERRATLRSGTHEGNVIWHGRAWMGPSDFGNPVGEPFSAGPVEFRVRAAGMTVEGERFELRSSVSLEVVAP